MRSDSYQSPLRHARGFSLVCIPAFTALILMALCQTQASAQQGDQNYGQYAPDEQPGYEQPQSVPQPGYAQPPYGQQSGYAPQQYSGPSQPSLNTQQLEQLVAPIALYPDILVAQVLAAATYPAQVVDADHWRQAQGYAPPDQIAAGADAQNWDPSLKALTAFPQLLAQMDQNIRWTIALGNAYYNQPQDVMDVVQVMRQRAQAAGNLASGPQEAVSYDQGFIQVAPVNPQVVYLPAYNPWTAYGEPVQPYRGFSLVGSLGSFFGSSPVRFGLGIAMSAFTHTSWGWMGWGLDWLTHSLLFHNSNYYSHSTTVADWGLPHGGPRAAFNRGAMNARLPNGGYRPQAGYGRPGGTANGYARSEGYGYNSAREQAMARPATGGYRGYSEGYARPSIQSQQAYNRAPAPIARPQQYSRPDSRPTQSYGGSGFYGAGRSYDNRGYEGRAGYGYGGAAPAYRGPAAAYAHNDFAGRSSGAYGGRGFEGYSGKAQKSGGFHPFGGGKEPKAPKAEKSFGHFHAEKGGHAGGHSGGHGGGGHHR
jgi:hypothetical protein